MTNRLLFVGSLPQEVKIEISWRAIENVTLEKESVASSIGIRLITNRTQSNYFRDDFFTFFLFAIQFPESNVGGLGNNNNFCSAFPI